VTGLGSRREHRVNSSSDYWFLSGAERGNVATGVHASGAGSPSWSEGNLVRPLIHGATYFARLHEELSALRAGDRVWFTDWRGDGDERLTADGPTIGELLARLARAGVEVRGLVWRSHGERVSAPMSNWSNELLSRQINDAGGEVLLDQRVRLFGCHHQKLFVIPGTGNNLRGTMPPWNCADRLWLMCWSCSRKGGMTPIPWTIAHRTGCSCNAWPICPGIPSPCRILRRHRHRLALTQSNCCAPTV
jgi:hypothetical protein